MLIKKEVLERYERALNNIKENEHLNNWSMPWDLKSIHTCFGCPYEFEHLVMNQNAQ